MRKALVPCIGLLLAIVAWWAAGPWLAIHGIERAIERRDAAALARHVDFPRLRANLKAQLDDQLVRRAGTGVARNPLGALALGLAGSATGMAVDTIATPVGIGALMQGHLLWKRASGDTVDGDTWGAPAPARPLQRAEHRYESVSRFSATVTHEDGRRTTFVLQRQGLRWKLVDIRLPFATAEHDQASAPSMPAAAA